LVDSRIYDDTDIAFPYTKLKTVYQIAITDSTTDLIKIKFNDISFLEYSGRTSYAFYVLPVYGKNEIKVYNSDESSLLGVFQFNCFNIHIFLASVSYQFKRIWNLLNQASANTFYDGNIIKDLDGNYLQPEYKYTKAISNLLGTRRYTKLTDSEYSVFLHNIFEMSKHAGTLDGLYHIGLALPDYIDRIDTIPIEEYLPHNNELDNTVFPDSTNSNKIIVYPRYIFNDEYWGLLNFYNDVPDVGNILNMYVDNDVYADTTDIGSLKVKYSLDAEFYKNEYVYTDNFNVADICDDTGGNYTGFINGKYIILRKPLIDNSLLSLSNNGNIDIGTSGYLADYNIVSLGTKYITQVGDIVATYKTYNKPKSLAILERDTTAGIGITAIRKAGLEVFDQNYLGYFDNNYGRVIIIIRVIKQIDNELKGIIDKLIRDVLPIHLSYFIVYSLADVWDYWGQENIMFSDFDQTGKFDFVIFDDLK
jgi:hypothetical protein